MTGTGSSPWFERFIGLTYFRGTNLVIKVVGCFHKRLVILLER